MSRHTFLLGVAIALIGCALVLTHELLGPWPGVNERNVQRIRKGMSMKEVETILGGPGRPFPPSRPLSGVCYGWGSSKGVVTVVLDWESDAQVFRVKSTCWWSSARPFARLRARLGW